MPIVNLPLFAVFAAVTFAIWLVRTYSRPKHRYPPGPQGLPLIGSLLDINNERPWITYGEWARQYGDIAMVWVLGKPTILLGKMQHAEGLLQKRMMNYGDRPEMVMAQDLVTQNGWYIGTSRTKHNTHKKQRKILAERLRAKALKDWAHPAEAPEIHLFLQRLVQQPDQFISIIKCFTVNVMLNTTFAYGSISNLDHPLIGRINEATDHQFIAQVQGRFWVDYVPFLKHLPTWLPGMGWKKQGLAWREEVNTLFDELWETTKQQMDKDREGHPCLVQALLETQMHQIGRLEGTTIASAVVDAGTETLTGTTVVFMIIFMYFPHILHKAQEVVDDVIGRERLPTFDDVGKMPYIAAMVREAFRWHTHIHEDDELYPNPTEYKPERFLGEDGQLNSLPHAGFGFGSRKCLGQHFAEQTLYLLIASFAWSFNIKAPLNEKGKRILPSLDPMDWGAFLASPPPMDFEAIITPRSGTAVDIINQAVTEDKGRG